MNLTRHASRAGLLATTLASLACAMTPAAASAHARIRSCKPTDRATDMALRAEGLTCAKAQTVERFVDQSDVSVPFRLDGRTWKTTVYSHAHHHTYLWVRSGKMTVWVAWRAATPTNSKPLGSSDVGELNTLANSIVNKIKGGAAQSRAWGSESVNLSGGTFTASWTNNLYGGIIESMHFSYEGRTGGMTLDFAMGTVRYGPYQMLFAAMKSFAGVS